ncbi:response regulator [Corynebacterium heidelbergense]|uniref:DNA-binding response regulator n=1 Tax=Corynebacterium heidelbergense TaxID=2055947 RepID=A0A364V7J4_9CORY|nr:response regulator [Corynebacterium heidelbergense]RAV32607.1 DNA-binding response regulator [Corynebacterium heidelbergense]
MSETERTKILLVEDDIPLANAVRISLVARKYDVQVATTATAATQLASKWQPDAVLLDLGLPDMSGLEVLRSLRSWSSIPVIVVSARHDQPGKINALDEGADDYVTKPFAVGELLARLRAALRRVPDSTQQEQPVVTTSDGRLEVDLALSQARVDGQPVHLTPREWGIVEYLVRRKGQLVPKADLLQTVWGPNYSRETNYLRVFISQVRQKLERDPAAPQHFLTELGVGYRFMP